MIFKASNQIVIEIRFRWWFINIYLPLLLAALYLARLVIDDVQPNYERLDYWTKKGTRMRVKE